MSLTGVWGGLKQGASKWKPDSLAADRCRALQQVGGQHGPGTPPRIWSCSSSSSCSLLQLNPRSLVSTVNMRPLRFSCLWISVCWPGIKMAWKVVRMDNSSLSWVGHEGQPSACSWRLTASSYASIIFQKPLSRTEIFPRQFPSLNSLDTGDACLPSLCVMLGLDGEERFLPRTFILWVTHWLQWEQIPFTTQLRGLRIGKLISSWYFLELYMFLVEMQQKFSDDITHLQKSFVFLLPKMYDAMKQCLGIMDTESTWIVLLADASRGLPCACKDTAIGF